MKVAGIVLAIGFAMIEKTFTSLMRDRPDGDGAVLDISGFNFSRGYTTWEQFWANVFYGPVLIIMNRRRHELVAALSIYPDPYDGHTWITFNVESPSRPFHWTIFATLFTFPVIVYHLEIVQGVFLDKIWGRRAWHYKGKWARFDGHVRLDYWKFWALLGFVLNVLQVDRMFLDEGSAKLAAALPPELVTILSPFGHHGPGA
jgi:hypothetical protein